MLKIEQLSVLRGRRELLRSVDLLVPEKSIHLLIGPSGAGKTTLLRAVAGLEAADGGRIRIGGSTVDRGGAGVVPPHRRGIAMVFQDDALWPNLTIRQHLEFGLSRRLRDATRRRERVETLLRKFGLDSRGNEGPSGLSGGERQRVGLARAFAQQPRLMLLDEPLAHVDLKSQRRLTRMIVTMLREESMAALWVTHRPEDVLPLADRASYIEDGRIYASMAPEDALRRLDGSESASP